MPVVHFVNEKKQIEVPAGSNLRRQAMKHGIQIYKGINKFLNCHGLGTCGTCRVLITKGMENTNPRTLIERLRLKFSFAYIGNEETMRLACQTTVNDDIEVVTTPPLNLYGENFYS